MDKKVAIYYPPKKKNVFVLDSNINIIKAFFEEKDITEKLHPNSTPGNSWHVSFDYFEEKNELLPSSSGLQNFIFQVCKQQKGKQQCGVVGNKYIPCRDCGYRMFIEHVYNKDKYWVLADGNGNIRFTDIPENQTNSLHEQIKIFKLIHEKGIVGKLIDAWAVRSEEDISLNRTQHNFIVPSYKKTLKSVLFDDSLSFSSFLDIFLESFSLVFELHQLGYISSSEMIEMGYFVYDEKNKLIFANLPAQKNIKKYVDKNSSKKLFERFANSYLKLPQSWGFEIKRLDNKDTYKQQNLLKWFGYLGKYMKKFMDFFKKKLDHSINVDISQVLKLEKEIIEPLFSSFKKDMLEIYKKYEIPIIYKDQPYFIKEADNIFEKLEACLLPKEKEWGIYFDISKELTSNPSDKKFLVPTYFGKGFFGSVYKGCRKKEDEMCGIIDGVYVPCGDCNYAVKIQGNLKKREDIEKIVSNYQKASEKGLCSPIHDWWICEDTNNFILIADAYEKTLLEVYQDKNISIIQKIAYIFKIFQMIHSLHQCKILHKDLGLRNIMVDKNGIPFFIDMDLSNIIEDTISIDAIKYIVEIDKFLDDFQYFFGDYKEYIQAITNYFLKIIKKDFIHYFDEQKKEKFSFDEVMQKEQELVYILTRDTPIPPMEIIEEEVKKGLLPSLKKYFIED